MPDFSKGKKSRAGEKKLPFEAVGSCTEVEAFDRKKECK